MKKGQEYDKQHMVDEIIAAVELTLKGMRRFPEPEEAEANEVENFINRMIKKGKSATVKMQKAYGDSEETNTNENQIAQNTEETSNQTLEQELEQSYKENNNVTEEGQEELKFEQPRKTGKVREVEDMEICLENRFGKIVQDTNAQAIRNNTTEVLNENEKRTETEEIKYGPEEGISTLFKMTQKPNT